MDNGADDSVLRELSQSLPKTDLVLIPKPIFGLSRLKCLQGLVGSFAPVPMAFAWTRAEQVPLILGQVNFFIEFDVCFFRRRGIIEVRLADV